MGKILEYTFGGDGIIVMKEDGGVEFIEKQTIAESFEKRGGSFVKSLGICLNHSDAFNTMKIFDNWREEVKEHIENFII